ncbi:DUF559 domain-containing protein [Gordonia sp. LSe1-13]|uniref:DUF559 domain-containing protein n=1 Tax=Gordonia sesuvii TaxID=3116777 RepID=A0ABU7M7D7_9ACTN|nr:DUF559 domain-containing protein [Gordonia sp. LSe1-13]
MTRTSVDDRHLVRRKKAVAAADMSAEQFATAFTRLHGDLYIDRATILAPRERIIATALSAPDDVVVAGIAAKLMHGGTWHDGDFTVELIRAPDAGNKRGRGRAVHRTDLDPDDVVDLDGISVTSVLRTALDIGRVPPEWRALGHLDDLARATGLCPMDLADYVEKFKARRGIRQLRALIPMIDGRSESPPESWLRLLMFKGDLPTPDLQVEVADPITGHIFARIDLAYEKLKIAIEYDGEDFHSTPAQKAHDEARDAKLDELGWIVIRITADRMRNDQWGIIVEIEEALRKRGGYF